MKFELFLVKRYLIRGKRRSFLSIISLISLIGITIGVAALIIAISLISGYQTKIRDKIIDSTAHIMVSSQYSKNLYNHVKLTQDLKNYLKDDLKTINPVIYGTIMLKYQGVAQGILLKGLNLQEKSTQEKWQKNLIEGELPFKNKEIILGKSLTKKMGLILDDKFLAIIPQTTLTPQGVVPKIQRLCLKGVFKSGLQDIDSNTAITSLEQAQKILNTKGGISYIEIFLKDVFIADKIAKKINKKFGIGIRTTTWQELNAPLYSALKLEKTVLFFTLTLIIIVASLNIIAGLIVLVTQKTRDIGVLRTYGATSSLIAKIFVIQGSIIGFLGTFFGVILGLTFCAFANHYKLIKIPEEIYQISHLPFNINFWELVTVISVSLIISLCATILPAKKATSIKIVDAVKGE